MKDVLTGLAVLVIAVAILVGGYYLGIIMAVFTGLLMILGIVLFIIAFVIYAVWDLFHYRRKRRQSR